MNFTSKIQTLIIITAAASLVAANTHAQNNSLQDLQSTARAAEQSLIELDTKASTCLSSFNLNLGEAAALLCDEFMRAIDGELLARYIAHCNDLKAWRDVYIQSQPAGLQTDSDTNARSLQLMVDTELHCGEGALQKRTEYVVAAFNSLRQGSLLNGSIDQSLNQRLKESDFETKNRQGQQALLQAMENLRLQREQATSQQMNSLENELIRQQIKRPNP